MLIAHLVRRALYLDVSKLLLSHQARTPNTNWTLNTNCSRCQGDQKPNHMFIMLHSHRITIALSTQPFYAFCLSNTAKPYWGGIVGIHRCQDNPVKGRQKLNLSLVPDQLVPLHRLQEFREARIERLDRFAESLLQGFPYFLRSLSTITELPNG